MPTAFTVTYVAFFIGTLLLCALALVRAAGVELPWVRPVLLVVAGVGVLALVARGVLAGHAPIFGTFENTLSAAVTLLLVAVVTSRGRTSTVSWAWATPWALILLLYGTRFSRQALPLTISEDSLWVDVHVLFAWISFASLVYASSLAVFGALGKQPKGLKREEVDDRIGGALNVGFLNLTAMMLTGAWYLYVVFAEFWRWEVVGTMSLVAWIGYGMVIHARYFYRLGGRGLAWAVLAVLPAMILTFWVWSLFPGTYHYFDILLLRPY